MRSADVEDSPGRTLDRVETHLGTSFRRAAMTQSLLVVSEAVARVAVEVAVAVDGLGEVIVGSTVTAGDAVVLVIWGAARWIVRISTDLKEAGQNYTKSMPGGLKSSTFGLLNGPPPPPIPPPPGWFYISVRN